ncbi:UDP-2,3-diacylglucosamine hydrolase [Marinobacterium nitratireducens]|uniref:UDP-2,3-diacylglucosamine hydrolase n=1 Tax=Marinobacterium nitratireducens TaxID=518897 RepID=A0A917Z5Z0_9GAMM|nr:UDP-2,3-diacylglucosamine diphosphatase [Marinobacterium nitratireducens]GGO76119.1 UDP-2,3-diacylglucosamine hydrolase [Marinobacterium nitratireducens]
MLRLFASDLHLRPERPDLCGAFLQFLQQTAPGADELYLLGDIFEAWIGDDAPMPGLDEVYAALPALAASGTRLYFQHGNRDFLVGQAFMERIGAQLLPGEQVIDHPRGPVLLMHGDQLCTDDVEYQAFRAQVRDPEWQRQFLAQSLEQRMAIARQLRDASKARGMEKTADIMDVNPQAVKAAMQQAGVELLIHGHTHRPAIHPDQIGAGVGTRIVLGDWDARGWYLRLDDAGFELIDFPID